MSDFPTVIVNFRFWPISAVQCTAIVDPKRTCLLWDWATDLGLFVKFISIRCNFVRH